MGRTSTGAAKAAPHAVRVEPGDQRIEADREERGDHQQQHPFPELEPQPDGDEHRKDPDDRSAGDVDRERSVMTLALVEAIRQPTGGLTSRT